MDVLGSITPLFTPNPRIRLIQLIGFCASLITFLYSHVPLIQFDPCKAKSQFLESLRWLSYENINYIGYRRYFFILRDINHHFYNCLYFSGLVWYEKL
ncbi:unnamed protein product [Linum tenue]|uniref:Uncharacterized protein n=1 Tax=Linum tenue TaxID=586396 RepID=A0AAV0RFR0_9ROSI|nr:unnamed protein product [Linum tenue]